MCRCGASLPLLLPLPLLLLLPLHAPASPPSTPCRKLPGKRQTCRAGAHRCRAAASQTHKVAASPIVLSSHRPIAPCVPLSHGPVCRGAPALRAAKCATRGAARCAVRLAPARR